MLAFEHAFAGRTLTLAQITDKPDYRQGLPTVLPVDYVPFFDAADPQQSAAKSVAVLKQHLARFPGQHAVMCMELVQGEGGYWAGERPFFMALIEVLKQAGVAVWFDEVQTFGRTTSPFAFQTFGLHEHADVVTVGKLTQVCATLFTDDYKPKPGLISQTFTAATAAIAAGRAILRRAVGRRILRRRRRRSTACGNVRRPAGADRQASPGLGQRPVRLRHDARVHPVRRGPRQDKVDPDRPVRRRRDRLHRRQPARADPRSCRRSAPRPRRTSSAVCTILEDVPRESTPALDYEGEHRHGDHPSRRLDDLARCWS